MAKNDKLHIVLSTPITTALVEAGLDVERLENAVNSALGELNGSSPVLKIGTGKLSKGSDKKAPMFKLSTTEKQEFSGAETAPLRFFVWNQRIEAAYAIASFEAVSLPNDGRISAWLAKFQSTPEEKAA